MLAVVEVVELLFWSEAAHWQACTMVHVEGRSVSSSDLTLLSPLPGGPKQGQISWFPGYQNSKMEWATEWTPNL